MVKIISRTVVLMFVITLLTGFMGPQFSQGNRNVKIDGACDRSAGSVICRLGVITASADATTGTLYTRGTQFLDSSGNYHPFQASEVRLTNASSNSAVAVELDANIRYVAEITVANVPSDVTDIRRLETHASVSNNFIMCVFEGDFHLQNSRS